MSGNITLNLELIKASKGSIEYVVIHELCHLIHHNHTKTFYDLQESIIPDWKKWKEKLEKILGGIAQLNRIPAAIFIVDISHEHIALAEASKLNVTTFGIVDTNSDPTQVDFAIPANDDASKSVAIIAEYLTEAIIEGLQERKTDKDEMEASKYADDDEELDSRGNRIRIDVGGRGDCRVGCGGRGREGTHELECAVH